MTAVCPASSATITLIKRNAFVFERHYKQTSNVSVSGDDVNYQLIFIFIRSVTDLGDDKIADFSGEDHTAMCSIVGHFIYALIARFTGPIWGRQGLDWPHVGPMNFAI